MAGLSSSCEELPTLAGWLPRGPAFMEALKWEQGSLHRAARHQVKTAQTQPTCPIQFPLEAVTSATNSVRAVMDKRKTLAFENIPKRDGCVQAMQLTLHVCCTIDLNVVNRPG